MLQNHLAAFLFILSRSSGVFLIAPFFGSLNIPVHFRAGAAFAVAALLFPVIDLEQFVQPPSSVLIFAASIFSELLIGALIGIVAYFSFAAINFAGKVMDMQVGFAVANVLDPTSGQQVSLIGNFLYNFALIYLVVSNGHHFILAALAESFRSIPIVGMHWNDSVPNLIFDFSAAVFTTGMKIAMPVTFAILLTNVGMGILARTMPQMNIFVVGIPLHLLIGISVLSMLVPFYILFLDVLFNDIYQNMSLAVRALSPP